MVRVGQVVEGRQVDGVDAHGGAGDGERGDDPGCGGVERVAEPEQADGEEDGFYTGEVKPGFRAL